MVSESTLLALTISVIGALTPIVVLSIKARGERRAKTLDARIRAEEKKQDWDRLDAVASAARSDAANLMQSQRLLAVKADEATNAAHEAARLLLDANTVTSVKLESIESLGKATHTLVNSNMTAEKKRSLLLLLEVVNLKRLLGKPISDESLSEIAELQATVADRERATMIADKEISGK